MAVQVLNGAGLYHEVTGTGPWLVFVHGGEGTRLLALMDHLEIDRAHLVGQSMGAWPFPASPWPRRSASIASSWRATAAAVGGSTFAEQAAVYNGVLERFLSQSSPGAKK